MCHLIDPELLFLPIFCQTWICSHDSRIAEDDIEPLGLGDELSHGLSDRRERRMVAVQKRDIDRRARNVLGLRDDVSCGFCISTSEIEMRWLSP